MRPLSPLREADLRRSGQDILPILLDAHGAYCSICERPLHQGASAWDPVAGALVSPFQPTQPSRSTLLVCATCAENQAEKTQVDTSQMELPGTTHWVVPGGSTETGFNFGSDGSLRPVGALARRTVEYFGLEASREVDIRAHLRGNVATLANRILEDVQGGGPQELMLLTQLVSATGFLSVWLTALASRLGMGGVVSFVNEARDDVPDFYPGTDWTRILPSSSWRV